jgi:hypothetical protein
LDANHGVYVADQLPFDIIPAQETELMGVLVAETPSFVVDLTVSSVPEPTLD